MRIPLAAGDGTPGFVLQMKDVPAAYWTNVSKWAWDLGLPYKTIGDFAHDIKVNPEHYRPPSEKQAQFGGATIDYPPLARWVWIAAKYLVPEFNEYGEVCP